MSKLSFKSFKINQKKIQNILLLILMALYFWGVGLKNNPLFSFNYHQGATIAFFALFSAIFLNVGLFKNKINNYVLAFSFLYSLFINVFVNETGLDIAFIMKMTLLFLLFFVYQNINLTDKSKLFLVGIIFLSFLMNGLKMLRVVLLNYNLSANKENSSVIGMSIAFGLLIVIPIIRYGISGTKKVKNIIIYSLYFLSLVTVFLLGARTLVLIISFYFILDVCLPKKILYRTDTFSTLFTLIFLLGVLFPYLYTLLIQHSEFFSQEDFLTGRQTIWGHLFQSLFSNSKTFLGGFGIDRQYGRWPHEHNGFLAILMRYGFIGLASFFTFWLYQIKKLSQKRNISNFQYSFCYSAIAILLMAYTEPILGIADYFIPIYFIFGMAFSAKNGKNLEETE